MRWLVPVVVAVVVARLADPATAEVVDEPAIVMACGQETAWDKITACLGKHGRPEITKDVTAARLVRLLARDGGGNETDIGSYLFVNQNGKWHIGGMYQGYGYQVTGVQAARLGSHAGWRLDVARMESTSVLPGGPPGVRVEHLVILCPGESYECNQVSVACDILVHGRAFYSFRGTLEIQPNLVRVTGDPSNAGMCGGPSDIGLD